MRNDELQLLQGTLDVLVLKTLTWGARHGYAIARWIRQATGERLQVEATVAYVDGRLVRFTVAASHLSDGKVVGTGEVTRVVVDRERFLSRVSPPRA